MLDALCGRISAMETTQQQMSSQLDITAAALEKAGQHQDEASRRFEAINQRFNALARQVGRTASAIAQLQDAAPISSDLDPDPSRTVATGKGALMDLPQGMAPLAANHERGTSSGVPGVTTPGGELLGGGGGGR